MIHKCNKEAEITELQVSFKYTQQTMEEMKCDIKSILDKFDRLDDKYATKKELADVKDEEEKRINVIDSKFWWAITWTIGVLLTMIWYAITSYLSK